MSGPTDRLDQALEEFHDFEKTASQDQLLTKLHPGSKLFVTLAYILTVVSFSRYELSGLLVLSLYPLLLFQLSSLSFTRALSRLRLVLPLVCAVGIASPFLEREVLFCLGGVPVSRGLVSMLSLMGKGILAVLASYLLMATTSMEKLCHFLRSVHVPSAIVVELLLIYRYVTLLLEETRRVLTAYHLRAPRQKGVAPSAWGSLVGILLLRSMDRAEKVYQSMCLRGFRGEFPLPRAPRFQRRDLLWTLGWISLFLFLRFVPVLEWLGGLFLRLTL